MALYKDADLPVWFPMAKYPKGATLSHLDPKLIFDIL